MKIDWLYVGLVLIGILVGISLFFWAMFVLA